MRGLSGLRHAGCAVAGKAMLATTVPFRAECVGGHRSGFIMLYDGREQG